MQPQATGTNPLSGSIICPSILLSIYPSVCLYGIPWDFCDCCISIILQCVSIDSRCLYPHTGFVWDPVGSSRAHISVRIYVSLSSRPHRFLSIIYAARNCVQRMQPQATGSNSMSDSIICPSICLSGCPQDFCSFLFVLNSSVGVQRCCAFIT